MDRLGGYFGAHESDDHLDDDVDEYVPPREAPPSPVGQDERRMQVRAYNHWASLIGDRRIPLVGDLQPEMLGDFGPFSVLLDLTNGVEDAQIAFLGHELAGECGEDAIASLNEVPSRSVLSRVTDHYMQILANEAPIGFEAEFLTERGIEVQYRGILLPYSSDGSVIDHVYGVINWREVADEVTSDELLLEIDQALALDPGEDADADDGAIVADENAVLTIGAPVEDENDTVSPLAAMIEEAYDLAAAEVLPSEHVDGDDDYDTVTDLEPALMTQSASRFDLPHPAFGDEEDEDEGFDSSAYSPLNPSPRANRGVDALGNPIGVPVSDTPEWDGESTGDYDRGIKTAADYGLPDWDDEEDEEGEDVDDLIDPLSGESIEVHTSSLMSMVSRGMKHKKSIDLSDPDAVVSYAADAEGTDADTEAPNPTPAVGYASLSPYGAGIAPSAYDDDADEFTLEVEAVDEDEYSEDGYEDDGAAGYASLAPAAPAWDSLDDEPEASETETPVALDDRAEAGFASPPFASSSAAADDIFYGADEHYGDEHDDAGDDDVAPEGLYDALASARVLAQAALNNEDRSRKTLYAAVSQAYDFSLEAQTDPAGYHELIAENGLTMQDRAPMTPIVKLVFGADYDKTRLTEYAAVLTYAHREGVQRGGLAMYLRHAEGGLKGVVQAERRARKEEQGKPTTDEVSGIRDTLVKKLRVLEGVDLNDIAHGEGEFALVMVRRLRNGALVVLGEVPEDVPLLEKAARKLLG